MRPALGQKRRRRHMIKGDLNRIGDYVAKEPLLATVADFLGERRAGDLEIGKYMIDGDRVYANVQDRKSTRLNSSHT